MGLTYKESGVDVEAGDAFVDALGPLAKSTHRPEVVGNLGGFAGLCNLPSGYTDPVLVAGTDGVGTKLKIAFQTGIHDTVGIDLVAMCVNDLICCGAEPLFFLDYFATGKLSKEQGVAVVKGIADGCKLSGCALLGGETAELPGFYQRGEYDLAGFAVGVVERSNILTGETITPGCALIGLPSSGLHSNGYSLARKALLEQSEETPWLEELLRPTTIYVQPVRKALETGGLLGIAHITGGGIAGNLVRILPEGIHAQVDLSTVKRPAVFEAIQAAGGIAEEEMQRTFNLGVGMILVTEANRAEDVIAVLQSVGTEAFLLGHTTRGDRGVTVTGP